MWLLLKITTVDSTVASTWLFLILSSFFALTRMPINFYQPISHSAGGLHMAPSPHATLDPTPNPGSAISTVNIMYARVCGLAQVYWEVERGGLYIMSLKKKMRMEECFANRQKYSVSCAVARPSCTSGVQVAVGLGSRDRPKRWGI